MFFIHVAVNFRSIQNAVNNSFTKVLVQVLMARNRTNTVSHRPSAYPLSSPPTPFPSTSNASTFSLSSPTNLSK